MLKGEDVSRSPEKLGAKPTGTPGVFSQQTFEGAYKNGFDKKRKALLAKKAENEKNNQK